MSRNHIESEATQKGISKTEDFYQAGERYRSLGKMDRDHLVGNLVDDLGKRDGVPGLSVCVPATVSDEQGDV